MPEELKNLKIDDIIKLYCELKERNEELEKENKKLSHELWIKNGCGYMGGS